VKIGEHIMHRVVADDISIKCLGRVLFIGHGETTTQSAQSANLS
jgi:hypothetical protein